MLSRTAFTIIALLGVALVVSSCAKLDQEEFEMWKNEHVTKMDQANSDMSNKITMLEGKVDQNNTDTTEAISRAKEEVIAASQQGDADTIAAAEQKAKEGDAQLRADLTKALDMQGKESMDAAKSLDAKLQAQIMAGEKSDKAQDAAIKDIQSKLTALDEKVAMVDMKASAKPMLVATVTFGSGQTGLSSKDKENLDGIVDQLMASGAKIKVVGHADGTPVLRGSHRSNWDLSQSRANSVAKYLKSKGIDAARIEAVGMAHTKPVASQNTAAGRAMNRRVEVILLPAGAMM
ncbi:OmpA family protein [Candidatus Poribacteria bacterium]|nr:OmpA family protein [Candidatus Poribacteria bacterium]MYG06420.1 OmpA family protein [Candidatus Poribacteria bacterium]MYK23148.1 OmpA family protein [Candidatus Poribacteria bacterium]